MTMQSIRPAYPRWAHFNGQLRDVVASLTDEQLAIRPTPERWPMWATVGHLACQRVSWLCGFAGESGADQTPFPNALYECPGDEYLEPALDAPALVEAIDSTFRIVENCLERWTPEMLDEPITRTFGPETTTHTRGWILEGSLAHDVYHCAELNEILSRNGLPQVNLWG